jgi:hypothetical protein
MRPSGFGSWPSTTLQSKLNHKSYEHNRALQVRRNVDTGSSLRLVRFALSDAIWPPQNAELADLSLSTSTYEETLNRSQHKRGFFAKKKPVDNTALAVMDFLKTVNLMRRQQGIKVIWTIEVILVV